jgi:uncharacterized protein (DUF58 family)
MRPTRAGVAVLLGGVLLLVLAVVLGYPELVALGVGAFALLGFAVLPLVLPSPVVVRTSGDLRVERGSDQVLPLTLRSGRSRALGGLRLRTVAAGSHEVVGVPALRPASGAVVELPVPTAVRGPVSMGPWRLERTDPWGLFRRAVARVPAVHVLVVPRVHPVAVGALPMADADGHAAEEMGSTYVATLREYVVGDELRHVHWRSSAKAGHLMVRQYVDSRRPGVDVVLDLSSASYVDDDAFEEAVDAAASIATSVATTGVPTSVITSAGEQARAGHGRHAGMLDLLAEVRRVGPGGSDAGDAGRSVGRGTPAGRASGASVVHVTGSTGAAAVLRPGRRRVVIRVGGRAEAASTVGGAVVAIARAADLATLPRAVQPGRRSAGGR